MLVRAVCYSHSFLLFEIRIAFGAVSDQPMTPKRDIQAVLRTNLPVVVKNMSKVANDSNAAQRERLKAIELLLRVAMGPSDRAADDTDVVAARDARNALSDTAIYLEQVINSTKSKRIRLRAVELANGVGKLER